MLSLQCMERAVVRNERIVEFENIVGCFVGRKYMYRFPTERQAKEFEAFANRKDEASVPVAIPARYRKYAVSITKERSNG